MAELIVSADGSEYRFDPGAVVRVGRHLDCDIVVADMRASRAPHLELRSVDGTWVLRDRSARGTFVNGTRVSELIVPASIRLRLADPVDGPEVWLRTVDQAEPVRLRATAPDISLQPDALGPIEFTRLEPVERKRLRHGSQPAVGTTLFGVERQGMGACALVLAALLAIGIGVPMAAGAVEGRILVAGEELVFGAGDAQLRATTPGGWQIVEADPDQGSVLLANGDAELSLSAERGNGALGDRLDAEAESIDDEVGDVKLGELIPLLAGDDLVALWRRWNSAKLDGVIAGLPVEGTNGLVVLRGPSGTADEFADDLDLILRSVRAEGSG